MTPERVIGLDGVMPWHLPADLQWFKRQTLNKPIVMGRKTYDSIGGELPNRHNIVVSRNPRLSLLHGDVVTKPEQALALAAKAPEVMIIGGAQLYEYFLPAADRLYLTLVDACLTGDTWFPDYHAYSWHKLETHDYPADERNPYACSFKVLERL